jgi:K(+)-stimulated pyrophosphate-energized sodium pump
MNNLLILPPILGVLGMVAALVVYMLVMKYPDGEDKVKKIGDQIHNGALAFMKTEYKYLLMFISVLVILVWLAPGLGMYSAISVIVGAACSSLAGFIGMYAATKANVRTATAAQKDGAAAALSVSFYGGSIMGLCVASLGLIGLGTLYYFFSADAEHVHALEGFGMGASVVALFFKSWRRHFYQKCRCWSRLSWKD